MREVANTAVSTCAFEKEDAGHLLFVDNDV